MIIKRIQPTTIVIGAPPDWVDDGSCCGLPVRLVIMDEGPFMVSAWEPTPDELARLNQGESIKLWVRGTGHPVVALSVGEEFLPPVE